MHETAQELHRIGLIDERKMDKYDLFCLKKVPPYTPNKIKTLRRRYRISQAVLLRLLILVHQLK